MTRPMRNKFKRFLRLRNSAGFTLVEVVVSCALLGVLIAGIMGFVTPILNSVRDKEQDARAVLLSKAVDEYVAATTQYAYFVTSVSGAATGDTVGGTPAVRSAKYNGTEFTKKQGKGLETLKTCFDKMEKDTYEIRCIGVRWHEDSVSGERKLMLTNEIVDQSTLALDPSKSKLVFEECFYDGLYPVITFENYNNQYQVNGVDRVEADKVDVAPGLMITTDVYTDLDCYSTVQSTREDAWLSYTGVSYVAFNNIRSNLINNKGSYEVIPNIEIKDYDAARTADSSLVYTAEGKSYYHPESFIYYIVRKTKIDAAKST